MQAAQRKDVLEQARLHVRRHFSKHIGPRFRFHDLEHTLAVTRTALEIGRAHRLNETDLWALELAALFHDTGYARAYAGHERESVRLAAGFLRAQGVPAGQVRRIGSLIAATRMGERPRTLLQRILCDADSAKAGQADFEEHGARLKKELETVNGRSIKQGAWARENLAYLEAHRFHTAYAERRFGAQKRMNLALARQRARQGHGPAPQVLDDPFFDRDLSWLAFNDRVLQEASDPNVPLLERIKFLAIYSSNLDEFYRVRVASLRSLAKLGKRDRTALGITTEALIARINRTALRQQRQFGRLYRRILLPALARHGIHILREDRLNKRQHAHVLQVFNTRVAPLLQTAEVREGNALFIEDRRLYLVCRLRPKGKGKRSERLVLLNVPSDALGRFVVLPSAPRQTALLFLDDVLRLGLQTHFAGHELIDSYAIKLSRDADLYLEEEFGERVVDKVRRSLRKRSTGVPSRFLYDERMPGGVRKALRALLGLKGPDMVAGGRYHHFSDLMQLPVRGHAALHDPPRPPLSRPGPTARRRLFDRIAARDLLLHFPYHDFGVVVDWLRQAARDPGVRRIAITLYRVAGHSQVGEALLEALRAGKQVTVFVEVQARFDERSNLQWGERLEAAGAQVLYSLEGLKVHGKLCLVERREGRQLRRYAYLGTGNFHEGTATRYADCGLFTADPELCREVAEVFHHLADRRHRPQVRHLLMAPTGLRSGLEVLIDREIEQARSGKPSGILLKVNSLEDRAIIGKLYDASRAGVPVRLIVRGICCLVPGIAGASTNIEGISIVDRYLEHARAYVFHAQGRQLVYLASADLMERNLDRRVEVAFPLRDAAARQEVLRMLELQWADTAKARIIDARQRNRYRPAPQEQVAVRAQEDFRAWLAAADRHRRGA
ncbi:MAG: polyphosphate kinase 1 [Flavobacteriales bacterium]|nr:Polyphosphate kinase [Flavobacteriales bacterium]MCC6577622.1 polyphosphate kinase 1 [Flavobacteriales bacterium]NUQ14274.1 polyphosphate kinase 1 [Flavobacteriales bacterium]